MSEQSTIDSNVKEFKERWLSDGIGEEYKKWIDKDIHGHVWSTTNVFIESPTGTGKTTFVFEKLFPYAVENKRNILYLSNRTALKEQLVKSAEDKYDIEEEEIQSSMQGGKVINVSMKDLKYKLTILNYQSVLSYIKYNEGFFGKEYDYVIFDEAHFFLEDSLFNSMTCRIFEKVLGFFWHSTLIFMSATIREFEYLASDYLCNVNRSKGIICTSSVFYKQKVNYYYNTYVSASYNPILYQKPSELFEKIKLSDKSEKWLIFVSSKNVGRELLKDIKKLNRSVAFITSESKNSRTWKEIVNKSSFNEDILITTSVLDNGVNIKGSEVKHIVLPLAYRVEFLQMLGRKRTEDGETVNIYAKVPTIQAINSHLRQLDTMIHKIEKVEKIHKGIQWAESNLKEYEQTKSQIYYPYGFEEELRLKHKSAVDKMTTLIQELWDSCNKSINGLFLMDYERNLIVNPLAKIQIKILKEFYSSLIEKKCVSLNYRLLIWGWLGGSESYPQYINSKGANLLKEYLNIYLDKEIQSQDELEKFYKGFVPLYEEHCGSKFVTDPQKLEEALHIRKEKARRKATINKALKIAEMPFRLIKKDNKWCLKTIR